MPNKEILKRTVKVEFNRPPISEGGKKRASRIEWTGADGSLNIRTITGDGEGRIKTVKENSFRLVGAKRRDYDPETGRLASQIGEGYDPRTRELMYRLSR